MQAENHASGNAAKLFMLFFIKCDFDANISREKDKRFCEQVKFLTWLDMPPALHACTTAQFLTLLRGLFDSYVLYERGTIDQLNGFFPS